MDRKKNYAVSLLSELNTLRKDAIFCDGVIKIDGKQFFIHKAVLSAASPYFRALFCNEWKETSCHEVTLQGVSSECFGVLLDYIYTGNITATSSDVEELLPAGRLFQLDDIVEYCCEFLIGQLTVDNSLGILAFAKLHSCNSLVGTTLNYVYRHFEEVSKTEEFLQLDSALLLSLLESDSIKISSEDDVFIALLRWTAVDIKNRYENFEHLLNHVKLPLVSPTIAKEQCALYQDSAKMLYRTYSTCLQEQKCSNDCSCPRTYSKKYFFVIGGLVQRYDDSLIDSISVADVRRCEVPRHPALEFKFEWTTNIQPMNLPRSNATVTSLHGLLYTCGGEDELLIYDSVECYNPIVNRWTPRAPLLSPRTNHSACAVNGEIYVVGGWVGEEMSTTIEKYNPDKNAWTHVGKIPLRAFSDAGVCELNGLIYIIGMLTEDTERIKWDVGVSFGFHLISCIGIQIYEQKPVKIGMRVRPSLYVALVSNFRLVKCNSKQ